ncbi:MAG TPA: DUF5668 domain-containing protein [Steroidobacteraceae bacterium]|nr:DUF5668 domain-containing protein [Steroidobacteraceae bacterium]
MGSKVIAGAILVIAGGALALGNSGIFGAVELQRSWPLALIAMGLAELVITMRTARQSGWALLLLGDWLFMNTMTGWGYEQFTWPLLLAGAGSWIIAGGITRAKRTSLNMDRHVA